MSVKKKRKVEDLISRVNEWCKSCEEYFEDDNGAVAEYAQSFGYGENLDKMDFSRIDSFCEPLVESLKRRVKDRKRRHKILQECCDLVFTHGHVCRDNELFSADLGEMEEQLPDELAEELKKLTSDEFEAVQRAVNCYLPDQDDRLSCGYFNRDSDRWSMILNSDLLCRALQDIPEPPETPAPPKQPDPEPVKRLETHDDRRSVFRLILGGAA